MAGKWWTRNKKGRNKVRKWSWKMWRGKRVFVSENLITGTQNGVWLKKRVQNVFVTEEKSFGWVRWRTRLFPLKNWSWQKIFHFSTKPMLNFKFFENCKHKNEIYFGELTRTTRKHDILVIFTTEILPHLENLCRNGVRYWEKLQGTNICCERKDIRISFAGISPIKFIEFVCNPKTLIL